MFCPLKDLSGKTFKVSLENHDNLHHSKNLQKNTEYLDELLLSCLKIIFKSWYFLDLLHYDSFTIIDI